MKFTSSYLQSTSTLRFEEEESQFNFEETQNKTLADLIPEIDALYGAVCNYSFEYFGKNLFGGKADIKNENELEGKQSDLNIEKDASSQSSTQPSTGIISQVAHSEAQSPKVDKTFITSLKKDDHQDIRDESEYQQQNVRDKPNKSNERKSIKDLKGSNQLGSIYSEKMKLKTIKRETRKYRARVHRQRGIKLKRWGRDEDKKVFSYLRRILPKYNLDLESFIYNIELSSEDEDSQTINCNLRLTILQDIIEKFNWFNTSYTLFKRFRKLAENQDFSFRESKLLRRTLRNMKNDSIYDFQVVANLFPGKFDQTIVKQSMKILKISQNPY